jgi:hypothetical protein
MLCINLKTGDEIAKVLREFTLSRGEKCEVTTHGKRTLTNIIMLNE